MTRPRNRSFLWRLRHRVDRRVRALLAMVPRRSRPNHVALADVKPRLDYYLRAVYGRPITVDAIVSGQREANKRGGARAQSRLRVEGVSESGGDVIRLPPQLVASATTTTPFEQYRCLAVQHAERLVRATTSHASGLATALEQDLFQLAEAVGVDRRIAATQPGLKGAMEDGRRSALRARSVRQAPTSLERRVEGLVTAALTAPMTEAVVPAADDATQSVDWARRTAAELARDVPAAEAGRYRRIAPLGLWGTAILGGARTGKGPVSTTQDTVGNDPPTPPPKGEQKKNRRPPSTGTPDQVVQAEDSSRDDGQEAQTSNPDSRPSDIAPPADDASAPGTASSEGQDDERGRGDPEVGGGQRPSVPPEGKVYHYPEWDLYAKTYHPEGSTVRARVPVVGTREWAEGAASEHAVLIRQVRERFAHLRAHRQRLRRQPNGDEIDLDACVTAFSDAAAGRTPDDRLYATVRATRREMAIMLLIDVSNSTDARVDANYRVIDIERVSALVAAEAFDALGDAYAINAFSSDGRHDVRIAEIKGFGERNTPLTGMRLAALAPSHATRLGAALRHATAELALRPESNRLLLVLSDGRPNDREGYIDQDYGVEDSRRAVGEARLAGVTAYCITIDPEEPEEYVGQIFGENGYRVLSETAHLPAVLVQAVQGLLRR